jgi:hypothetical protein
MSLNDYMKQTQRFIRDSNQTFINPDDVRIYVNRARRELALRTQSVRILTPVAGGITAATITAAGSGYVDPVATISAPDFPDGGFAAPLGTQATATCQQIGGVITNINITNGGAGYFSPVITITDNNSGPGTGATATVAVSPLMQTQAGQEIYTFDKIPLANFPGVGEVFWVNSVSLIYSAYRYRMMTYSFLHVPSADPQLSPSVYVRAFGVRAAWAGHEGLALRLPRAVRWLPDGMGLLLPAERPDRRSKRGSPSGAVDRLCALLRCAPCVP